MRFVPLDRLITETDSPYVAPPPNRGRRNDPTAVTAVVESIASIRGEDLTMVRDQLVTNAMRLFALNGTHHDRLP